MGKDVEEGEISDTASVEEISEEDFKIKQEEFVKVVKETKPIKAVVGGGGEGAGTRVWTVRDLYNNYSTICRGYGPGLHNFAWAQAVQNKPLNEIFVKEVEQDDVSKRSSPASSVASVNSSAAAGKDEKKDVEKVVIDDSGDEMEKEEGELEEGEIEMDLESESYGKVSEQVKEEEVKLTNVDSIREALESVVNVVDGEKLFQGVCSKLENTLESLGGVVNENNLPTNDALIQLAFSAVQSVHSVFCSMNNVLKEQNKEIVSRLLSLIRCNDPPLFSSDHLKEMEVMVSSLGANDKENDMQAVNGLHVNDSNALAENVANDLNFKNKLPLAVDSLMQKKPVEPLKPMVSGYKSRGVLLPLLDPHKVHDVDSLPSPTRETTFFMPMQRALVVGDGINKSGSPEPKVAHDTEVLKIPRYETEAFRAFSFYQQKFGHNSFFMNNELPSPTPSEESGDGGGDTGGEISSASTLDKPKPVNPPTLGQQIVSSQPMDISSVQGLTAANNLVPSSSGSNPVLKPNPVVKASVKSRDPRLRFASLNALDLNYQPAPMVHNEPKVEPVGRGTSSRKQKTVEEPVLDGPAPKRQRNGFENSGVRDEISISGSVGWLEDADMVEPQIMNRDQSAPSAESNHRKLDNGVTCPITTTDTPNVVVCGNEPVPVTLPSTRASLTPLLKNIAVNPTILLNILKMGQQQKLAAEAMQKSSNDTSINTKTPPISSSTPPVNVTASTPSAILPKPMGAIQVSSQGASMDELRKVRMKPRDPRRVLQGNALQRSGSLGPELKTDGLSTPGNQGIKENLNFQMPQGTAEAKPVLSHSVLQPDFTRQFTKNLKDITDFVSVSQPLTSEPIVSQNLPIQPGQIKLGVDVKAIVLNHDEKQTGTGSGPEVCRVGAHPQNSWGDVEHLFERYDDQQKAAIQRERARRMEEQKKMFSARKLCLVLDLDHTLLNSAKFHEVDPEHDEILRKKEQEDREKPQRHLFRFPHMGMWTKLRPGIWTFLERASKLFELHLYTMGNKLYATEMAKVLDPKGVLFSGRVISRGDDGDPFDGDERVPKSKDLEGVLGMESAVVIIDDSVRVWPHNKLNLIVVERYTYFPCSRRQFGLLGPSLLEIDHDERPEDGTLASSLGVIERVHKIFFSHQSLDDLDVRNILAEEQSKILAGCRIVFSRVFPVGEANPHLHPLWQTAQEFGAVCTNQIDDQVTHVVANSLGTDKVNWALSTGRFVVHPGWVEASALLYRRANEQDFGIKP